LLIAGLAWLGRDGLRGLLPAKLAPLTWPDTAGLAPADQALLAEARRDVEAQEARRPRDRAALAAAYAEAGRRLLAQDLLPAADAALANAEALDPGRADWPYYRGYAAVRDGRQQDAIDHYRRALDLGPADRLARLHLAEALVAAGRAEEGAALLEPLLQDREARAPAHFLLGEIGLAAGKPQDAVAHWELALDAAPEASLIHQRLADAYRQLGAMDRSEAHLALRGDRRVGLADPRIAALGELQQSAGAKLFQGSELMSGGQYQAAAERFQAALALEPANLSARLNLGAAYMQLGKLDEAEQALRQAYQQAPLDPKVLSNLAQLRQARGDLSGASTAYATAVAVAPDQPNLLQARLQLELRRGGCAAAMDAYRAYLAQVPSDLATRQHFLLCLAAAGGWMEAQQVAQAGHDLAPADFAAADGLVRILAAAPDAAARDGQAALALAQQLAAGERQEQAQELLAMALAESGRFGEAAGAQARAVAAYGADKALGPAWLPYLESQLAAYRAGRPCRQPWPPHLLVDREKTP
jgi:predicted Zn-dependent protease